MKRLLLISLLLEDEVLNFYKAEEYQTYKAHNRIMDKDRLDKAIEMLDNILNEYKSDSNLSPIEIFSSIT